jgi:TRAP-type C4-dicarboxylate transport system permease small subunit
MVRKINTKNLYKLIRNTVFVISFLCLLAGVIYRINYNGIESRAYKYSQDCYARFSPAPFVESCEFAFRDLKTVDDIIYISLPVGFGLPIAFFVVRAIINYVTKEEK